MRPVSSETEITTPGTTGRFGQQNTAWNSIRAQEMHREKKRANGNSANPLIFLMELRGVEPRTS